MHMTFKGEKTDCPAHGAFWNSCSGDSKGLQFQEGLLTIRIFTICSPNLSVFLLDSFQLCKGILPIDVTGVDDSLHKPSNPCTCPSKLGLKTTLDRWFFAALKIPQGKFPEAATIVKSYVFQSPLGC